VLVTALYFAVAGPSIADPSTEATKAAAEQGNAEEQASLGVMYEFGIGVIQDYAEAVRWYHLAAEQGLAFAQGNLGIMYYNGKGVPQDYVMAHMWANLAAAQGNTLASKNRGITASKMTSGQIAEAQRLAREWRPKAN
jgi:TPR repeat protein